MKKLGKIIILNLSIVVIFSYNAYACTQPPTAIIDIQGYPLGERETVIEIPNTLVFKGNRSYDNDEGGLSITHYYWYVWEEGQTEPVYPNYDYEGVEQPIPFNSPGTYYVRLQVEDNENDLSTAIDTGSNTCVITTQDLTIHNALPFVLENGNVIFNGRIYYDSGTPTIRVYYGTSDGQMVPGNWQPPASCSETILGEFESSEISGLDEGTLYYFRSYAEFTSNPSHNDWDETAVHRDPNPIKFFTAPGQAHTPNVTESSLVTLEWQAGAGAEEHRIYLGNTYETVDAAGPFSDYCKGEQDATDTDYEVEESLTPGSTYYWRVDEILYDEHNCDVPCIRKGQIWDFTLANAYTLILDKSGGEGQVFYKLDSQSYIPVEVPYSKTFANPTNVSVKAEPALHYAFVRWEDSPDHAYSTENPMQLTLEDNLSLTAVFEYEIWSPSIQNAGTSQIDKDSARIQGYLGSTGGADPTVLLYYDTDGGGENPAEWSNAPIDLGTRQTGNIYFDLPGLEAGTEYFFRFYAENSGGTDWADTVLSFTTAPGQVTGCTPTDGTSDVPLSVNLNWSAGQGAVLHNVYFGTTNPPPLRAVVNEPPYTAGALSYNEYYYWRIDEVGVENSVTSGQLNSFSTLTGYELTALATEGGNILVAGSVNNTPSEYLDGTIVTLEANSEDGYYFVVWQGEISGTDGSDNTLIVPMDQPRTITAIFASYPILTVNMVGEGHVTVILDKSYYDLDEPVELQAVPDMAAGYVFDHWEQDLSGSNPLETLTMNASKTVKAVFTRKVYYVSESGNDSYSGMSWDDAFLTLQKALDMVAVNPDYQIWVAAGTYYPDEGPGQTDDSPSSTFTLVSDVKLYGGFLGNETSLEQRDPKINITILSGDINQSGDYTNNSYHVVKGANNAILDGFTITRGYAYHPDGIAFPNNCGAGIQCIDTSPTIRNCLITENTALYGGGVHNQNSNASVIDCVFSKNIAEETGGSIYNENCADPGLSFTNCEFIANIDNGASAPSNPTVTITSVVPNWYWSAEDFGQGEQVEFDPEDFVTVEKEIKWGNPHCGSDYKSGMRFTGTATGSKYVNEDFALGTLCHSNYTTSSGTAITKTKLTVTLVIGGTNTSFSFFLDIDETDNGDYNELCGNEPEVEILCCNDTITLPSDFPSQIVNIDGREYTLEILGFGDNSGVLDEEKFDSEEWSSCDDNVKTLWARITPPPTRGAVKNVGSTVKFKNCSFVGNTAKNAMGGALANWNCENVALSNCTITGNHGDFCGGIYNHESNVYIKNSILWGNVDSDGSTSSEHEQLYNVSVDPQNERNCTVTYGCIQDDDSVNNDYTGDNNIYENPALISDPDDGGDGWGDDTTTPDVDEGSNDDYGNLRLQAGSPCIDAGNNEEVSSGVVKDLDGLPRFVDDPDTPDDHGNGTPPIVDMGAYEYQLPVINLSPVAVDDATLTSLDMSMEIDILSNDFDPEGDAVEISSFTDPVNGGTLALTGDGQRLLYTPASDFVGTDYFTYEIREIDNPDNIASASVAIDVTDLVVDAGQQKTLVLPESSAYLFDARAEGGLPGSTITCQWEEISIPLGASINYLPDNTVEKPTVEVTLNPEVFALETPAVFVLRLKAFENGYFAGQDEVRILVYPGGIDFHSAPALEIGTAVSGSDSIEIPAQFWDDGKPFGYLQAAWSQVSGPGQVAFLQDTFLIRADRGELIASDKRFDATADVTFTVAGTYKLKLNVWDGNKGNDDYIDVVAGAEHLNQPPVVNAGEALEYDGVSSSELIINLSDDLGSGAPHSSATDPDGDPLEIEWTKIHGPVEGVEFDDPSIAAPVLTFTKPGNYVFKLQASDGYFTVDDLLSVTITTPTVSMNVNAGPDQTILLPSDVTLSGTVTGDDPDGVTWSLIKRPVWGQVTITNPNNPSTTAGFDNRAPGIYVFQLEAHIGMVSVSDTVTVYVYPGIQVSGGYVHSLLRDEDGYVWSFGKDTSHTYDTYFGGVLGRNYDSEPCGDDFQLYPKRVLKGAQSSTNSYLQNIKDISAGFTHCFALEEVSGRVWVWGGSAFSELEIGTPEVSPVIWGWFDEPTAVYANASNPDYPNTQIENISSVIAAGKWVDGGHSLFLDNNEHVLTCGENDYRQLGNGTSDDQDLAMYVVGEQGSGDLKLSNIIAVDGGIFFSLALEKDDPLNGCYGRVYSWGSNDNFYCRGALGIGNVTGGDPVSEPVKVHSGQQGDHDDLENIVKIAAGQGFCMALEKYDPDNEHYGRVFTWGSELHSTRAMFGNDDFATEALGNGSGAANQYEPVLVWNGAQDSPESPNHLSGIIAISAGEGHAMALEKYDPDKGYYGRVFTWGANKYYWTREHGWASPDAEACGVLGNGNIDFDGNFDPGLLNSSVPVVVCAGEQDPVNPYSELKNIISIAAGAEHCMAIDMDGKVWVWGVNGSGQLGTGDRNSCALPRQVTFDQKVHNVTQNMWYYGEIQPAINEASSGNELVVYPGQYTEAITIPSDKSLIIHSINPSDWDIVNKTIIDGTNLSLTADEALVNISAPNVEFRGFTIQNSLENGIKITSGDDITIFNNIISGNSKNGIEVSTATVEISNNFIVKNGLSTIYDTSDIYHGIRFSDSGTRTVSNNTIVLNHGYGVCQATGSQDIDNSIIWNNILGQLQNCTSVNSITDTDPGLNNVPSAVDKTTMVGSVDRIYVNDATLYNPGQIIEYADDGIPRIVIVVDATDDYVRFSPALTLDATQEDKVISFWYSLDSGVVPGDSVTTSGNGDGYNGNENKIEVPSSEINNFEIGDIIQYEGQYREILGKNETEYTLMVCDGMGEGIPLDSSSEEGKEVWNYGNPAEWGLNLTEDYHLRYSDSSISIDQITPWSGVENQTDLDGQPRLMGASIDIGADEYTALKVEAGTNKELQMPLDGTAASLHLSEASVLWGDFENEQYPEDEITVEWSVVSLNSEDVEFHGLTETPENEIRPTVMFAGVGSYQLQLTAVDPLTSTVIGGDRIAIEILPGIDAGGPYEVKLSDVGGSIENIDLTGIVSGLVDGTYNVTWSTSNTNYIGIENPSLLTEAYATVDNLTTPGLYGIQLEVRDSESGTVLGTDTAFVLCNYELIQVSAGGDKEVTLSPEDHAITIPLCGSVSGIPASSVEWELVSGSVNTINFETSNTSSNSLVKFTEPGTYVFAFHAYDAHYYEVGADICVVTVSTQTVTVKAGQDQFIDGNPYLLNLEGKINAQDTSGYSTHWFCVSDNVQFGNATHPNTWVRFTSTPAAGKYTCILVAYDSLNKIVAADSTIITVDGGDSWIPSPVISAGGAYGPVSVGGQLPVSGLILDATGIFSTMWIGENASNVLFFDNPLDLNTMVTCFEAGQQTIALIAFDGLGNVIGADSTTLTVSDVSVDAKIGQVNRGTPVDELDVVADSFGPYEFTLYGSCGIVNDNIHTQWIYEGHKGAASIDESEGFETKVSISEIGRHTFVFKVMNGEQVIAYDTATVNITLSGFYIDIFGSDRVHYWASNTLGSEQEEFKVLSFGQLPSTYYYQWSCTSGLVEFDSEYGNISTANFSGLGDFPITCTLYEGEIGSGTFLAEDTVIVHVTYGYEVNAGRDRATTLHDGSATVSLDDAFITLINSTVSPELMTDQFDWIIPVGVVLDYDEDDVDSKLHPVVTINDTGIYQLTLEYYLGGTKTIEDNVRIWVYPDEELLAVNAGDDCTISSPTNTLELKDAWVLPSDASVTWSVQSYPADYPANGPQVVFEPSENEINPRIYFPITGTYVLRLCPEGQPDIYDDITMTLEPWEISDDTTPPEATIRAPGLTGDPDNVNGSFTIYVEDVMDEVDGSGMQMLELVLLCDGGERIQLEEIEESPWAISYVLNTYNIPNGAHTLIAYPRDKAGNIGVSNSISFTSATDTDQNPISNFRVNPQCATELTPTLTFTATIATVQAWELYFDDDTSPVTTSSDHGGPTTSVSLGLNVIVCGEGGHQARLVVGGYEATVPFAVCTEDMLQANISAMDNINSEEIVLLNNKEDYDLLNNPNEMDGNPPPIVTGSKYSLIGTAYHDSLFDDLSYQVMVYDNDYTNYINVTPDPSLTGYRNAYVQEGELAELDFSDLPNGVYNIELFVRYKRVTTSVKKQIILDCPLKIGNVKFAQQDLVIPIGGLPLQVIRSYDSFQKDTMGDFGFGWNYALTSMDIELNEPPAAEYGSSTGYFDRDVTLTLPSGQRTTFQFELQSCSGSGIKNWKGVYQAPEGITASLQTKDPEVLVYGGGLGGVDYFWDGHYPGVLAEDESVNLGLEDFSGFTLKLEDGTQYNIERASYGEIEVRSSLTGEIIYTYDSYAKPYLESIYLSTGETVKFVLATSSTAKNPIIIEVLYFPSDVAREDLPIPITELNVSSYRHLSSKSIEILRDDADRIIAINAPSESGQIYTGGTPTLKYDYDDEGNLEAVHVLKNKDTAEYDTTYYSYEDGSLYSPEDHYVTDIKDPRGLSPIRYLYDNSGKLIGTMDAKGNVIEISHARNDLTDPDYSEYTFEEVTDRNNNTTRYFHNDRGNVVAVQKYDSDENFLSMTQYEYESYSEILYNDGTNDFPLAGEEGDYPNEYTDQPCKVTDNAGNSTYTRYDTKGRVTQTIDPEFNKTVNQYNTVTGNLILSTQYKPKRNASGEIDTTTGYVEFEEVSTTQNIYTANKMLIFTGVKKDSTWYSINLSYYDDQNRITGSVQINTDYVNQSTNGINDLFTSLDTGNGIGTLVEKDSLPDTISTVVYEHVKTHYVYHTASGSPDQPYTISKPFSGTAPSLNDTDYTTFMHYDQNNRQDASWTYADSNFDGIVDKRIVNVNQFDAQGRTIRSLRVVDSSYLDPDSTNIKTEVLDEIGTLLNNGTATILSETIYNKIGKVEYSLSYNRRFDETADDFKCQGDITFYDYDETGNVVETWSGVFTKTFDKTTATSDFTSPPELHTLSQTLYDAEGRMIVSVGPYVPGEDTPVGTETVYDALGRAVQTRRWANVNITFEDLLGSDGVTVVGRKVPNDRLAANAWAEAPTGILTWTSDGKVPVAMSTITPDQIGPQSYTRTIYDATGRVLHSLTLDEDGYEQPTSYKYDAAGRQITVIDPQGHFLDNPNNAHTLYENGILLANSTNAQMINFDYFDYTDDYYHDPDNLDGTSNFTGTHRTDTYYDGTRRDCVEDALGNITFFEYDALGRVIKTQHPPTNIDGIPTEGDYEDDITFTHVAYDGLGRKQYELDRTVQTAMPLVGGPIYRRNVKTYAYDISGRLITVEIPQVRDPETGDTPTRPVYQYYYDEFGNQVGIRDPKGRLTVFKYDHLNRQTHKYMPFEQEIDRGLEFYSQIDLTGKLYEYTEYDEYSRIQLHLDYKQQATKFTYNALGQLEYKYYYEADGDLDGDNDYYIAGTYTEYVYYTYDTIGRQETITDTTGTTTYYYGNEGQIESIESPQGTINYEFNPITGQKTRTYTPDLNTDTDYFYDALGRLEEVATTEESTHYGYDEVGNRAWQCIDTTGDFDRTALTGYEIKTDYTYNDLNRLTNLIQQKTGPTALSSFNYALAADGMRKHLEETIQQPTGSETRDIDYSYDNLNRLDTEIAVKQGTTTGYDVDYTYDLAGNRTKRVVNSGGQTLTTEYEYYPGTDKLKTEEHCGASCAMTFGDKTYYAYMTPSGGFYYQDSSGNKISQFKAFWMGLPSVVNRALFYTLMFLIPAVFFWPVLTQWRKKVGWAVPTLNEDGLSSDLKLWHRMLCVLLSYIFLVGPEAFHYLAQAEVQYANLNTDSWGSEGDFINYCYDENGSMTYKFYGDVDVESYTPQEIISSTSVAYDQHTYNLQNRLARIDKYDGSSPTPTESVEYQYNAAGIRVAKIEDPDGTPITTTYLIDPSNHTGYAQVLEEWRVNGTTAKLTTYTLGDDVISQTKSNWLDTTEWEQDGAAVTQYLLYDGHGSTRQLVSVSDDATPVITVADTYSYDGYGVMLQDQDNFPPVGFQQPGYTPQQATNLLYAGEQFDTNAQQYYLRARYYNSLNGIFNRVDPYVGNMQDPQSLHKYAYCHNNPVNMVDPTGMMTITTMVTVSAITAALSAGITYSVTKSWEKALVVGIAAGIITFSILFFLPQITALLSKIANAGILHYPTAPPLLPIWESIGIILVRFMVFLISMGVLSGTMIRQLYYALDLVAMKHPQMFNMLNQAVEYISRNPDDFMNLNDRLRELWDKIEAYFERKKTKIEN